MTRYMAFDPESEVIGASALAFITNMNHDDMEAILEKHGLNQIEPQQWYPVQSILDVMSDISKEGDASSNLVAIGMEASELGLKRLPDHFRSLSLFEFLGIYDNWYKEVHRNTKTGYVKTEQVDENYLIIRAKLPYPDDLLYGIFFSYARNLAPQGKSISLSYDAEIQRRDEGGEETTFHLRLK